MPSQVLQNYIKELNDYIPSSSHHNRKAQAQITLSILVALNSQQDAQWSMSEDATLDLLTKFLRVSHSDLSKARQKPRLVTLSNKMSDGVSAEMATPAVWFIRFLHNITQQYQPTQKKNNFWSEFLTFLNSHQGLFTEKSSFKQFIDFVKKGASTHLPSHEVSKIESALNTALPAETNQQKTLSRTVSVESNASSGYYSHTSDDDSLSVSTNEDLELGDTETGEDVLSSKELYQPVYYSTEWLEPEIINQRDKLVKVGKPTFQEWKRGNAVSIYGPRGQLDLKDHDDQESITKKLDELGIPNTSIELLLYHCGPGQIQGMGLSGLRSYLRQNDCNYNVGKTLDLKYRFTVDPQGNLTYQEEWSAEIFHSDAEELADIISLSVTFSINPETKTLTLQGQQLLKVPHELEKALDQISENNLKAKELHSLQQNLQKQRLQQAIDQQNRLANDIKQRLEKVDLLESKLKQVQQASLKCKEPSELTQLNDHTLKLKQSFLALESEISAIITPNQEETTDLKPAEVMQYQSEIETISKKLKQQPNSHCLEEFTKTLETKLHDFQITTKQLETNLERELNTVETARTESLVELFSDEKNTARTFPMIDPTFPSIDDIEEARRQHAGYKNHVDRLASSLTKRAEDALSLLGDKKNRLSKLAEGFTFEENLRINENLTNLTNMLSQHTGYKALSVINKSKLEIIYMYQALARKLKQISIGDDLLCNTAPENLNFTKWSNSQPNSKLETFKAICEMEQCLFAQIQTLKSSNFFKRVFGFQSKFKSKLMTALEYQQRIANEMVQDLTKFKEKMHQLNHQEEEIKATSQENQLTAENLLIGVTTRTITDLTSSSQISNNALHGTIVSPKKSASGIFKPLPVDQSITRQPGSEGISLTKV